MGGAATLDDRLVNLRALLLGAFIGAAAAWYLVRGARRKGRSPEAADRIWHSIVGDRDIRTDALTERVH